MGSGVGCETGAGNMLTGDILESFCAGGIDVAPMPLRLRSLVDGDLGRLRGGGGVCRLETLGLTELRGGDRIMDGCDGLSGGSRIPLPRGGDNIGLR